MPIPRDRRVAILREWGVKANPYLAGVFDRLCADIATRAETPVSSGELAPLPPRTLEDYIRSREPGEEG